MKKPVIPIFLSLFCFSMLSILSACTDSEDAAEQTLSHCKMAVISSDYSSSSLSFLKADGSPCALDVLHSGSKDPALLSALSGDLAFPSRPSDTGQLYLIDRYPNAVVSELSLSPLSITKQWATSPGFMGNPQDLTYFQGKRLLLRMEPNQDGSEGGDLIELLDDGTIGGRISLQEGIAPGFFPMPSSLQTSHDGRVLWITLLHATKGSFDEMKDSIILAFDKDLELIRSWTIEGQKNCGKMSLSPHEDALFLVCSGHMRSAPQERQKASGIWRFNLDGSVESLETLEPERLLEGEKDGLFAFPVAALSNTSFAGVLEGDLIAESPDRAFIWTEDEGFTWLDEAPAYSFSSLLWSASEQLLFLAKGDPYEPLLLRYKLSTEGPQELAPIEASKTGLPPRELILLKSGGGAGI